VADYIRKIELRGLKDKTKVEGEDYSLGEQTQYFDIWNQDGYLQFMYERLQLLRELLSIEGSIYIHMDEKRSHYIKLILDEIFSPENFRREIIWDITVLSGFKTIAPNWIRGHDCILYYSKSATPLFNKLLQPHTEKVFKYV